MSEPVMHVMNAQPLNVVLGLLGDQVDPLQDISDVVDAPFLDVQHLRSPVEVDHAVRRLSQEIQEAFGGQIQRRVVAGLLRSHFRH